MGRTNMTQKLLALILAGAIVIVAAPCVAPLLAQKSTKKVAEEETAEVKPLKDKVDLARLSRDELLAEKAKAERAKAKAEKSIVTAAETARRVLKDTAKHEMAYEEAIHQRDAFKDKDAFKAHVDKHGVSDALDKLSKLEAAVSKTEFSGKAAIRKREAAEQAVKDLQATIDNADTIIRDIDARLPDAKAKLATARRDFSAEAGPGLDARMTTLEKRQDRLEKRVNDIDAGLQGLIKAGGRLDELEKKVEKLTGTAGPEKGLLYFRVAIPLPAKVIDATSGKPYALVLPLKSRRCARPYHHEYEYLYKEE